MQTHWRHADSPSTPRSRIFLFRFATTTHTFTMSVSYRNRACSVTSKYISCLIQKIIYIREKKKYHSDNINFNFNNNRKETFFLIISSKFSILWHESHERLFVFLRECVCVCAYIIKLITIKIHNKSASYSTGILNFKPFCVTCRYKFDNISPHTKYLFRKPWTCAMLFYSSNKY